MKKWTKRLVILMAAMVMCMLLGTLVSAAEKAAALPLDGKERLYTQGGQAEEEPDQVGGKLTTTAIGGYDGWDYYRIKVTGYALLTISGRTTNNGSLGIKLLNKDGYYMNPAGVESDIRYTNSSRDQVVYYGVKSGTYYIMVRSSTTYYYLGAREDKKANRAGASMGRAYSLAHNKTIPGVMPCYESWKNADWYTFYLSSNSRFKVYLTVKGSGYIDVTLYGPGISSRGEKLTSYGMNFNDTISVYRTLNGRGSYGRPAGRYYIKISRSSQRYPRTSCTYWLRWKIY